jgi:hypothetical protein
MNPILNLRIQLAHLVWMAFLSCGFQYRIDETLPNLKDRKIGTIDSHLGYITTSLFISLCISRDLPQQKIPRG